MPTTRYSYLPQQFSDPSKIFEAMKNVVLNGDYTLGAAVTEFEERFAKLIGVRHALGVGSGTDALKLSLKAAGIGPGDQVITAANTFVSTVGAIYEVGAEAVLVDCDQSFCIDCNLLEGALTEKTRAIIPVHLTGNVTDMPNLMKFAERHDLIVIEDCCQAILSSMEGKTSGTWGLTGAFSLHPLKNLNVWGDGGVITTDDDDMADRIKLLRNNGVQGRDSVEILGYNSRLDTIQAVVANWLLGQTEEITEQRIQNAAYYDAEFSSLQEIQIPRRPSNVRQVYHIYMVFAEDRDSLYDHCVKNGVEAKIHYEVPLYLQKGLAFLGHGPGDFPETDRHARSVITFPVDQHLNLSELEFVVSTVKSYYARNRGVGK